jgi:hypothetical protein
MKNALCLLILFLSAYANCENKEIKIIQDYARCASATIGNFDTEAKTNKATKVLYVQAKVHIDELIIEIKKTKNEIPLLDVGGKEFLAGYMLATFEEELSDERAELLSFYDFKSEPVNQILWEKHGCNAIYSTLNK